MTSPNEAGILEAHDFGEILLEENLKGSKRRIEK
jgi:hypothetical protein